MSINGCSTLVLPNLEEKFNHDLDRRKRQFPYFDYLLSAHGVVRRLVKAHDLPVNPEHLFNNIVAHSLDHYLLHHLEVEVGMWSYDGGVTLASYFRSMMLRICTPRSWNPFQNELIKYCRQPFYKDLYTALKGLNPEYCLLYTSDAADE